MRGITVSVLLTVVLLLAGLPELTCAQFYTYKDAKGTVAYVDDLGKIPSKFRSKARLLEDSPSVSVIESAAPAGSAKSGAKQQVQRQQKAKNRFSGTIEMYVTAWCPRCKEAEAYLKKMNYPFVKHDVEKDKSAKDRAEGYPGQGVPLIVVGKRTMRGFSPEALEQYMDN